MVGLFLVRSQSLSKVILIEVNSLKVKKKKNKALKFSLEYFIFNSLISCSQETFKSNDGLPLDIA